MTVLDVFVVLAALAIGFIGLGVLADVISERRAAGTETRPSSRHQAARVMTGLGALLGIVSLVGIGFLIIR
ncbi:MAG TPA: hypothetical protein VFJ85_08460 [Acidimicrobiales bacterium]|nr:hypothetical protein [Acidimicrobiales bacterium]